MSILKHLETLQHVSIIIQIIFREFVSSLLKSLNLKVLKILKLIRGDAAVCVVHCVERYVGLQSSVERYVGLQSSLERYVGLQSSVERYVGL